MARRSHFANAPSDERGSPLTPQALTKQEFGRRLQQLLDEKNWSQADLARAVLEVTGEKMGRDAISTYINGRSFPTPASLNLLCKAFDLSRDELFPNATMIATNDEHPAFEMKAATGQPGKAWVRVNRLLSFETAAAMVNLINEEDRRGSEGE
jgi:transcriptional regulator with XRE-family HTH domain